MSIAKLFIFFPLFFAFGTLNAQDNQLYDYVQASIDKTRAFYFKRDSLLIPNYKAPNVEGLKPLISVNGKTVDMDFLKLIIINDTTEIRNVVEKAGYVRSGVFRRYMINGLVLVEVDKKVFRNIWKTEKVNYPKKKKR